MDAPIEIRKAESVADYIACQEAQRKAWGLVDESYVVPLATMIGAQHHGGLVLGAFLPDGQAVGLSFAFLGRVDNSWCLYSQLTGIIPGYQGQGIGGKIKEIQREYARAAGLEFIAWAFDPLQSGNAFFNLHRLGATSRRYLENMYGLRTDALNAGVPTDRLIAEWPTEPKPVTAVSYSVSLPKLVEGPHNPVVRSISDFPSDQPLLVEIPPSIANLRSTDAALAERWRAAIAQGLTKAFASGYRAADVIRDGTRSFYVVDARPLQ